jgi:hypothetical protein
MLPEEPIERASMSEPNYEQKVRDAWERVHVEEDYGFHLWLGCPSCSSGPEAAAYFSLKTESPWQAAWEFTEQRQEEVRQIEEEIVWVASIKDYLDSIPKRARIVRHLQAIRDDLRRGMK